MHRILVSVPVSYTHLDVYKRQSDNYGKQRLYYAKTRDFYSFTEPELYIEKDESSIDTTIIYNEEDKMYYRYTKNEGGNTNELGAKTKTIFAEKSSTLLGNWTPCLLYTSRRFCEHHAVGSSSWSFRTWVLYSA